MPTYIRPLELERAIENWLFTPVGVQFSTVQKDHGFQLGLFLGFRRLSIVKCRQCYLDGSADYSESEGFGCDSGDYLVTLNILNCLNECGSRGLNNIFASLLELNAHVCVGLEDSKVWCVEIDLRSYVWEALVAHPMLVQVMTRMFCRVKFIDDLFWLKFGHFFPIVSSSTNL